MVSLETLKSEPLKPCYMSVDGGGTKVSAILYDQSFNLMGYGKSGGINQNGTDENHALRNMTDCIAQCFNGISDISIERIDITMPGDYPLFCRLVAQYAPVKQSCNLSEGEMCVLAGMQTCEGVVALAGTGSGAFCIRGNDGATVLHANIGGYGSMLGDEGGGFDIGRKGMIAAIHSSDGRGGKSLLEEYLLNLLERGDMPSAIGVFYALPLQKRFIADFARTVITVSRMGDNVATGILAQAGKDMGLQIGALFNKTKVLSDVCLAGSVWKCNPVMLKAFSDYLAEKFPSIRIVSSRYEPVMGGIVKQWLSGCNSAEWGYISENFRQFEYGLDGGEQLDQTILYQNK